MSSDNQEDRKRDDIFRDYFLSLGKFIDVFSQVEKSLNHLLRWESQVNGNVAAALFRGFRVDSLKDAIKRIRSVSGLKDDSLMERIFSQMTIISAKRNDIVHFGAEVYKDDFFVSNTLNAHNEATLRSFSASPTVLNKMSRDLEAILCGLAVCLLEAADRNSGVPQSTERLSAISSLRSHADIPWQYIPPQPSPMPKQSPQTGPRRQRPPRASRRSQQPVPETFEP